MRNLFALAVVALMAGCSAPAPKVMGTLQPASLVVVNDLKTQSGKTVQMQGTMIEKCPTAGCWFVLKDKTGTVRVDTKAAGFVVSELPLQTVVTVSGKVSSKDTLELKATGLQY